METSRPRWPLFPSSPKRRALWMTTAAVLVTATTLRACELDHHLPYLPVPGEAKSLRVTLRMLLTADPNPRFFHYPSLPFYAWATTAWAWAVTLGGSLDSLAELGTVRRLALGVARAEEPSLVLVLRLWSLALGVGAVAVTIRTGWMLFPNRLAGLLAGALLALSPLHAVASVVVRHEVWLVFFVALSMYFSARVYQEDRVRDSVLAGLCAGLAVSCKYNGWIALTPLAMAHLLRGGSRRLGNRAVGLGLLAAAAAFLLTSPFVLLDFPNFQADLAYELNHYASDHVGRDHRGASWYLATLLRKEFVATGLAAVALVLGLVERRRAVALVAVLPLACLVNIMPFPVRVERLLLPMLPALCLLAGFAGVGLGRTIVRTLHRGELWVLGLALASLAVTGLASREALQELSQPDARDIAREWIAEEVPAGSRIALESYGPYVDDRVYKVKTIDAGRGFSALWVQGPAWYRQKRFDYLVLSSGMSGRYLSGSGDPQARDRYRVLTEAFPLVKSFELGGQSVWIHRVQ